MITSGYFTYFILTVMIISAVGVVTARNIFRAALLLGLSLLSVAGVYLLLGAEFLAAVQVLIYVGGILLLIIFGVMLTRNISDKSIRQTSDGKLSAFLVSALTFAVMVFGISKTPFPQPADSAVAVDAAGIGRVLLKDNILPFEIASVLLLAALVGAIIIARKETEQ